MRLRAFEIEFNRRVWGMFQFYCSAIKRNKGAVVKDVSKVFQFYCSAIKSTVNCIVTITLSRFNSTVVRLRDYKRFW